MVGLGGVCSGAWEEREDVVVAAGEGKAVQQWLSGRLEEGAGMV